MRELIRGFGNQAFGACDCVEIPQDRFRRWISEALKFYRGVFTLRSST